MTISYRRTAKGMTIRINGADALHWLAALTSPEVLAPLKAAYEARKGVPNRSKSFPSATGASGPARVPGAVDGGSA